MASSLRTYIDKTPSAAVALTAASVDAGRVRVVARNSGGAALASVVMPKAEAAALAESLGLLAPPSIPSVVLTPGQNISAALDRLGAGGTVMLRGGLYSGQTIRFSADRQKVTAYPGEKPSLVTALECAYAPVGVGTNATLEGLRLERTTPGRSVEVRLERQA